MREPIFTAIKTARGGAAFTQAEVSRIDALLDSLSVPGAPTGLAASPAGVALIKSFEGCKLTAYPDPGSGGDPWTIGFGATGAGIRKGVVWTQAQADARIVEDVAKFARGVADLIGDAPTTQNQFDAMVSLAYNIGLRNFGESTLLKLHKNSDYVRAGGEFAKWNRAAGKAMEGLTRRRAAEAKLYRGLT